MGYHRREGHTKQGVSKDWFIDAVDCHTRFMVSSKYFKSRGQTKLEKLSAK